MSDDEIFGDIVTPDGVRHGHVLSTRSGLIESIRPATSDQQRPEPPLIVPGFIDIQVNGVGAVDVSTATASELAGLSEELGRAGVSAWLPTVVTRPLDSYSDVFATIESAMSAEAQRARTGADILGVHMEGPFLGQRPGAHRPELMVAPTADLIERLPESVRLMTLGAEVAGGVDATRALVARGVRVSIGHTAATNAQLSAAREAGATLVTHLFNAMTGVHHREDGVAAWALTDDDMYVSIIADGHHVREEAISIALRCKHPNRLIGVTDSVAHLKSGLHGGGGGEPASLTDGTLAGSTVAMAGVFRNLVACGASVVDAAAATATNPAELLGIGDRGRIEPGARADLVALDHHFDVVATWRNGCRE